MYKEQIDKLTLPTEMGEITILPEHIPLIANLAPGEMLIHKDGEVIPYAVSGGFVEVRPGNHVIVLADAAEHVFEIDLKRAEEARDRAQKLMEGVKRDDVKFAEVTAALERSLVRLRIARKHKTRSSRIQIER